MTSECKTPRKICTAYYSIVRLYVVIVLCFFWLEAVSLRVVFFMHFLLILKNYDDTDAVLDVKCLAQLANKHQHHVTLLTQGKAILQSNHNPFKTIVCKSFGIDLLDDWLFQRAFRKAMATGEYDRSLSFSPMVEGVDFYVPRRFRVHRGLDALLHRPYRLWQLCHSQIRSYFMYVTKPQAISLQTMGGVSRARLIQIDPEYHEECLPRHDDLNERAQLRRKLSMEEKHLCIVQVADDWHRQGVDNSLSALGALPHSIRTICRFVLLSRKTSQRKLEDLAEECNFPPINVINLGTSCSLADLLPAADILLHPAREEEAGTMLLDAMISGTPVVCTDSCGYSIFLNKTCCPVIPMPYHHEAVTDALSFTILHLNTFKKMLPTQFARLGLKDRYVHLLHALETKPNLRQPMLDQQAARGIVQLHQKNLTNPPSAVLKNEAKRAISVVTYDKKKYLVKEFKSRPWWHFRAPIKRTRRGTELLVLYTPQICGEYHDKDNGSDYLIFPYCGDGNFFQLNYAYVENSMQLYSECGSILAELHDAGIYHHDTKPANFVRNNFSQQECPKEVCLVDCDNVTHYNNPVEIPLRIHNLAQFIAGTGKLARQDRVLWRKLISAFCEGYSNSAMLPLGDLDQLWQRVWRTIESQSHIEYTLPDDCLEESTQLN